MLATTPREPEVQTKPFGKVTIGRSTFDVNEVTVTFDYGQGPATSSTIELTGSRGGSYFLRAIVTRKNGKREETGVYQIISWKNGQPYRVRGNEVQAVTVGDIIETHIGPRF